MAKALLERICGPDSHLLSPMRRLRQRMRDLKVEIARIEEENDLLAAEAGHDAASDPRASLHLSEREEPVAASPGKHL